MSANLRLLILTDTHYTGPDGLLAPAPEGLRAERAPRLIREAMQQADRTGGFEAVALLGDLISSGNPADQARAALAELRSAVATSAGARPVLVVPGNHDGDPEAVLSAFDQRPGEWEIAGCRVITFADPFDCDGASRRAAADFARLKALARRDGGPIIALQHYPIHLGRAIEPRDYYVVPTNVPDILEQYAQLHVTLSLSGHLHVGDPLHSHRGVLYYTARPLTAPPFYFAIAVLQGFNVLISRATLE